MDRLDFNHMLMTKAIGNKLFLAPIDAGKVHNVLDIGTGTGICKFITRVEIAFTRNECLTFS